MFIALQEKVLTAKTDNCLRSFYFSHFEVGITVCHLKIPKI